MSNIKPKLFEIIVTLKSLILRYSAARLFVLFHIIISILYKE